MPMAKANRASSDNLNKDAALRTIVEGTASETGERFFAALVKNLAKVLNRKGAWVTEYLEEEYRLRALAFWLENDFVEEYEYDVRGTPCEPVIQEIRLFHVPEKVVELFPDDPDLPPLDAVSYIGMPLLDVNGKILGHLAVLDSRPMPEAPNDLALIRIFAARAAA